MVARFVHTEEVTGSNPVSPTDNRRSEHVCADAISGTVTFTDGPFVETKKFLGGLTVVDVPDDDAERMWAGKIAEACGWPQEVRRFKPRPETR